MDLRKITENYFVSPQLETADMPAVAASGIVAVICNRPDEEVPVTHQAAAMRRAAETAGLTFHVLPLTHLTFTPETVGRQRAVMDMVKGPVLAYCASGTRSTIAWALGQAGEMSVDEILSTARDAGYDLSTVRPSLENAAAARP